MKSVFAGVNWLSVFLASLFGALVFAGLVVWSWEVVSLLGLSLVTIGVLSVGGFVACALFWVALGFIQPYSDFKH